LNHKISKGIKAYDKKSFRTALKKILGYRPGNTAIYKKAFIHRSATFELPDGTNINNERLEYLGDAILDAVLSEFLFKHYPKAPEGELTKLRSKLANRSTLNKLAASMGLNELVDCHINSNLPTINIYGDALEALIGAIFIDKGYTGSRKFIARHILGKHIDLEKLINTENDYKSQVFQWAQKMQKQVNFDYDEDYDLIHKKYIFKTVLRIDHEMFGEGMGTSKKEAEQKASRMAVKKINKTGFIS